MTSIYYNFSFLFKLITYILIPVVLIVIATAIILKLYTKKIKETNRDRYNYIMNLYPSILAIIIVGILFAIVAGFAISFTNTMRVNNLVNDNKIIYYIIIITPIIPLSFLLYYIRKLILLRTNKEQKDNN